MLPVISITGSTFMTKTRKCHGFVAPGELPDMAGSGTSAKSSLDVHPDVYKVIGTIERGISHQLTEELLVRVVTMLLHQTAQIDQQRFACDLGPYRRRQRTGSSSSGRTGDGSAPNNLYSRARVIAAQRSANRSWQSETAATVPIAAGHRAPRGASARPR